MYYGVVSYSNFFRVTIWVCISPLPNLMNFREYLGVINFSN